MLGDAMGLPCLAPAASRRSDSRDGQAVTGPNQNLQKNVSDALVGIVDDADRISYTEALPVLYKRCQLHFNNPDNLIYLERTTRVCRFNLITWVSLIQIVEPLLYDYLRERNVNTPNDEVTWEHTCDVLAGMSGLRHLRISLQEGHHEPSRDRSWEEKVLRPLGKVRVRDEFLLELSWKTRESHLPDIEGPFRIVRFDWWSRPE
jgi:hypothetical protein